jgi:hypothetical protein
MRGLSPRIASAAVVAILVAGCGGAAASPSPSPQPDPPAGSAFRLRVTQVQALPPGATFSLTPQVLITLDGRVLQAAAIPAIFPGPLVMPILERAISAAGWARLVDAARSAGLLGINRDFTGGQMPPGAAATRLELVADGRTYDLLGDQSRQIVCVTAPCVAPAGTPEAFAGFVNGLSDLASMVGAENLGQDQPHNPAGYAVIVGEEPDDQGLAQPAKAWPLDGGFAAFGKPLADGSGDRCGTITGTDVGLVRPAFNAATQITSWRDPADGSLHGLVVRPLLPGDPDPCAGLV